jgi:PAS domain S-box-containing protein
MPHSPNRHGAALFARMAAHPPDDGGGTHGKTVHPNSLDGADCATGKTLPPQTETESQYQNFASDIPALVFQRALNPDGSISFAFVNDGAWTVAGLDPEEMSRNAAAISERIHPDDLPGLHADVLQAFTDLRPHTNEFRYNHPTIGWRWIHTVARPRRRSDGSIVAEAIAFDITDRKDTERELDENRRRLNDHLIELQDTKERLEQRSGELIRTVSDLAEARDASDIANRAKSDFLATMSHEIRTPMNGVLGMASLLKQTVLDPSQQEFVDTIEQSGEALLSIINDVLDYSKMEAGQLELDPTTFSVPEIIDNAIQLIRPKCGENGLILQSFIDPAVPDLVIGDAGRLRQILLNLLGNAAKFTKDGVIKVECLRPEAVGRELEFNFAVADTGIGVPEEAQKHLFEVFSQADASTTRKFGGTGLGLSICRRLCHLMGGEISVESILGEGSTFRFKLRLKLAGNTYDELPRPDRTGDIKTALVAAGAVTPDAGLERQLNAWGIHTEIHQDDVALLDRADIPGASGGLIILDADALSTRPDLRAKLNEFQSTGACTVWLIGQRYPENQNLGVTIDIPLRQSRLQDHIQAFLKGTSITTADAQEIPPSPPQTLPDQKTGPATPLLKILLVEDNKVNQRVAMAMLEAAELGVTLAENGRIALEILARQEHFDVILMDIHMPEMDGITAARKIRELPPPQRDIPIIALTANAMKGDREKYLDAGMNDYVSKPVDPVALASAIERQARVPTDIGSGARNIASTAPLPTITETEVETLFAGIDDILK